MINTESSEISQPPKNSMIINKDKDKINVKDYLYNLMRWKKK